jgi:hypothetical protein
MGVLQAEANPSSRVDGEEMQEMRWKVKNAKSPLCHQLGMPFPV